MMGRAPMIDKLFRTITQLGKPQQFFISIKIEADANGHIDRECPSEICHFSFKVREQGWRDKENAKIECGEAHFKALGVGDNSARYVVATKFDDLSAEP